MKFENQELQDVYDLVKSIPGLKVFTTQTLNPLFKDAKYTYFYITDGERIVYCERQYSGVIFYSVRVPKPYCGSGFGLTNDHIINVTKEDIERYLNHQADKRINFEVGPRWENWEAYMKDQERFGSLTEYREL